MRVLRLLLLALSLPAGIVGFAIGGRLVTFVSLPDWLQGLVTLFVPLLIGGLCMIPFVVLFFDHMAKRDLAAHRASEASASAEAASQEASSRDAAVARRHRPRDRR